MMGHEPSMDDPLIARVPLELFVVSTDDDDDDDDDDDVHDGATTVRSNARNHRHEGDVDAKGRKNDDGDGESGARENGKTRDCWRLLSVFVLVGVFVDDGDEDGG